MRMNSCALNSFMFQLNIVTSPGCSCGAQNKTVKHYLLDCPNYIDIREKYFGNIFQSDPAIHRNVLLFGDSENDFN